MVNIRLKNPNANQLLGALFAEVAAVTKEYVTDIVAKEQAQDGKMFYWRGNNPAAARKVSNANAIPTDGITPLPSNIGVITGKSNNIAHKVAVRFQQLFARAAPRESGRYATGIVFMINGKIRALSSIVRYGERGFAAGETVTIYSNVIYASKLEADYYRRNRQGIWRKITMQLIAEFGSQASIKYTTVSGNKLGAGFAWNTPTLNISNPGQFASGVVSKTGESAKRKARKAARLTRAKAKQRNN